MNEILHEKRLYLPLSYTFSQAYDAVCQAYHTLKILASIQ